MFVDWLSNAYAGMSKRQVAAQIHAAQTSTNVPGFARASSAVGGEIIITPPEGLIVNDTTVMSGDFPVPVYEARPAANKKYPILIIVPEIFGLHEHIKDVARRFAQEGFLCTTFEPYAREGGLLHLPDIPSVRKVADQIPDTRIMEDIDAILGHAKRHSAALIDQIGITGFCRGGMYTLLYAARNTSLKAAVAWYGQIKPEKKPGIRNVGPLDVATKVKIPVLGLYGAEDVGIPVADVKEMEMTLRSSGLTAEFIIYPGAPHAFFADYRPSYRTEAAKDAWRRCVSWFKKYLNG